MVNVVDDFNAAKRKAAQRFEIPTFQMPSYAGLCPGHQQVCGKTHGAICAGEAGITTLAAFGPEAPGLSAGPQIIKGCNLQPGAVVPAGLPRTKTGYMGHLPGKHFSSNFGKNFATASEEWLATDGKPAAGGIPDPGQPMNANPPLPTPYPWRQKVAISGYAGFRPRTTPNVL